MKLRLLYEINSKLEISKQNRWERSPLDNCGDEVDCMKMALNHAKSFLTGDQPRPGYDENDLAFDLEDVARSATDLSINNRSFNEVVSHLKQFARRFWRTPTSQTGELVTLIDRAIGAIDCDGEASV
jgi:hypothetical protein